jgi:hypothetical protein
MLAGMSEQPPNQTLAEAGEILPPDDASSSVSTPSALVTTPAGAAALAAAHGFVPIAMMAG